MANFHVHLSLALAPDQYVDDDQEEGDTGY